MNHQSPIYTRYKTDVLKFWEPKLQFELMCLAWASQWNHWNKLSTHPEQPITASEISHGLDAAFIESQRLEQETGHETVARLRAFESLVARGSKFAHAGLTSSDIQDKAVLLQSLLSMHLVITESFSLLDKITKAAKDTSGTLVMGRTHLQIAEPTTVGFRLMLVGEAVYRALKALLAVYIEGDAFMRILGGAVGSFGTLSMLTSLMRKEDPEDLLFIEGYLKSQVLPRDYDLQLMEGLSRMSAVLHKFAADFRIQAGFDDNLFELAALDRVGSSAMPYKKNPIAAERICSLSRHIPSLYREAWDNAAHSYLERTLDDSANRRYMLPEAFSVMVHMLKASEELVEAHTDNIDGDVTESAFLWEQGKQAALDKIKGHYPTDKETRPHHVWMGLATAMVIEKATSMERWMLGKLNSDALNLPSWGVDWRDWHVGRGIGVDWLSWNLREDEE